MFYETGHEWDFLTADSRKVGGVVHLDALSVAHIQQGGVFFVKMETQQLLLNGESQCFHCGEERLKNNNLNRINLYSGCGYATNANTL